MARARNIKPSFFKNEDLVEFNYSTRLLFIGLWTLADREGRLEDRPKRIKMELFPADDVDVCAALGELEGAGFIESYEVAGKKVIQIINFLKHQAPHHTEKSSELPDKNGDLTVKSPLKPGKSRKQDGENPPDSLIPDSLNPESLPKEQSARASRLAADWVLPDSWRAWAEKERPELDVQKTADAFRDYWIAKAGKEARKLNWEATWRNWIRSQRTPQAGQPRAGPRRSGFSDIDYEGEAIAAGFKVGV